MDKNYELLQVLETNNADEREAMKGYYYLLDVAVDELKAGRITEDFFNRLAGQVEDYISEEMKHSKGLQELAEELSNLVPEGK